MTPRLIALLLLLGALATLLAPIAAAGGRAPLTRVRRDEQSGSSLPVLSGPRVIARGADR